MWTDGSCWGDDKQVKIMACTEEDEYGYGSFPWIYRGLFSFHTRLNDWGDSCIENGSTTTAGRLRKFIRGILLSEGVMLNGRDVFPASLWNFN